MPFYLDACTASGVFIWYSGRTAKQDRASLMVYEVERFCRHAASPFAPGAGEMSRRFQQSGET